MRVGDRPPGNVQLARLRHRQCRAARRRRLRLGERLIGGPLHDRLDCRPDTASYVGRSDDLRITLGDGSRKDGGPADGPLRDRLVGVAFVSGGDGDDVLVGDAGENSLFYNCGPGIDAIIGTPDVFDPNPNCE